MLRMADRGRGIGSSPRTSSVWTPGRVLSPPQITPLLAPSVVRGFNRDDCALSIGMGARFAAEYAREAAGLSKAELARAISTEPAVIRRLFSSRHVNPTLGRLAEVAAALGMRVTLEPLPDGECHAVTDPLLEGRSADTHALGRLLTSMREKAPATAL